MMMVMGSNIVICYCCLMEFWVSNCISQWMLKWVSFLQLYSLMDLVQFYIVSGSSWKCFLMVCVWSPDCSPITRFTDNFTVMWVEFAHANSQHETWAIARATLMGQSNPHFYNSSSFQMGGKRKKKGGVLFSSVKTQCRWVSSEFETLQILPLMQIR